MDPTPLDDGTALLSALRRERDEARALLELAGTAIVVLDRDGQVTLANRAACALLGHETLVGCDWHGVALPIGHDAAARAAHAGWMSGSDLPPAEYEEVVVARRGTERLVRWRTTLLCDDEGRPSGLLAAGEDITDQRRAEERVTYLAYHDGLTGLPNRTLLEEHLTVALARGRRAGTGTAVLQIDVDDLRLVNDSLGHLGGDELLCRLAVRFAQVTRATDLLARTGGDEFLVLVADIDGDAQTAAEQVAVSVLECLEKPFLIAGTTFQVGASLGVAVSTDGAIEGGALLRQVQAAQERAKRVARGAWVVHGPEQDADRARLGMTGGLRRALEHGEFVLHYQPIYTLADGEIVGCEALLRWDHPERGLVAPGDFIALAEETGLIEPIGDWVVGAVCEQQVAWAAEGFLPSISFNVSPRQLRRLDFGPRVAHHLLRTGADAGRLVIELTESATLSEPERVEPLLDQLNELGLGLAIDDFGAGHSSLSRLRDLPVQTLKIDRSFLRQVPADREATTIIRAIVRLTRALGMTTIAEGVESEEQHEFLRSLGCPLGQGFLMARPITAAEVLDLSRGDARPWRVEGRSLA